LGNLIVRIEKDDVPVKFNGSLGINSLSFTSGIIEELANAFYGITQWNVYAKEDYFDQILLPTVNRPSPARVLSLSERTIYRKDSD
jgi:hypothetical protein